MVAAREKWRNYFNRVCLRGRSLDWRMNPHTGTRIIILTPRSRRFLRDYRQRSAALAERLKLARSALPPRYLPKEKLS